MGPDAWWIGSLAAGAILLLSLIAFLSAVETAVLNTRRSRLPDDSNPRRLAGVERILEGPDPFLTSAHLAKSLCESLVYACAALLAIMISFGALPPSARAATDPSEVGRMVLRVAWPGVLLGALSAYLAVTALGESLPKALATRAPERLLFRWHAFIRTFTLLFTPVVWITVRLARVLARSAGAEPVLTSRAAHSEEEIMMLVEGSAEEGVLEEEEKEMIHSIFEFTETVARQVMVPRIDICSAEGDMPVQALVEQVLESGHSRFPVYEGTLDNIIGVVHVKDLLPHMGGEGRSRPVRELVREAYFVPEGKKIDELLQEFRTHKNQMAIVVDEFGGTAGLVTVEDVLEEIVGEIEDEYDVAEQPGVEDEPSGEGSLVDGRMTLADVNELLELRLPHEEHDTIGGFVFSLFGRPPRPGERVAHHDTEFVAEAMDGLRIQRVRVIPRSPATADAGAAPAPPY